jgi:hypothetical protein
MKKASLIGSAALLSTFVLGLMMVNYPAATSHADHDSRTSFRTADTPQKPVTKTFRTLKVAAKSLAYFPLMERAIAATNPEVLPGAESFTDAEVRLTGVGPLRIGMTLEEATDALGLPVVPLGRNPSGECAYYQPDTLAQALGLMVVDNRVIRVDVWPGSSLKTVSGAAIGMTEAELEKMYAGQIEATPNPYTQGKFLTFIPSDPEFALYRLVFETDAQGTVVQYRTGQFPAVTWPDGCV